jgi:hypothetical protein
MSTPSKAQLLQQLRSIQGNGLLIYLRAAAEAHGLPVGYVVAVASRETNCVNELGDYQGGQYHGVGIMQRDIQHPEAKQARDDGSWKTPAGIKLLVDADVEELAQNCGTVRGYFDDVTEDDVLRIAADGYNDGISRALRDANDGGDPDRHTTGHDYGEDVMARKAVFDVLLGST